MTKTQPRQTQAQTRWSQHIAAWEASGLTQADFCQHHQLVYGTFVYWRHHLKKTKASNRPPDVASFLPVSLSPAKSEPLMLRINDRHSIELRPGFDPVLLCQVVQALEHAA
jgi:hypothetical protein